MPSIALATEGQRATSQKPKATSYGWQAIQLRRAKRRAEDALHSLGDGGPKGNVPKTESYELRMAGHPAKAREAQSGGRVMPAIY